MGITPWILLLLFLFSSTLISSLFRESHSVKYVLNKATKAAFFGLTALVLIYSALLYLAVYQAKTLIVVRKTQLISMIQKNYFGQVGAILPSIFGYIGLYDNICCDG